MSFWNDENIATLRRRWDEGASASTIAAEIGAPSRNSVLSKVHRLGISERAKGYRRGPAVLKNKPATPRGPSPSPRPRLARTEAPRDNRQRLPSGNLPPLPYDEAADAAMALEIPAAQRKTFHQLGPRHCNWPIGHPGTPEFFFCGGDREPGITPPYCPFHTRKSLPGPSERRGEGVKYRMLRHHP